MLDGDGGAVRPGGGSLVPHGDGDGDGVRVLGGRQPAAVQHGVRGAVRHQAGAAVHHRQRAGVPGDYTAPPLSSQIKEPVGSRVDSDVTGLPRLKI